MNEDRNLIKRFNAGDTQVLRRIYEKYKADLASIARAILHEPALADDVLHDVVLEFASQAGKFRLRGSLKGYLAVCVANRARNVNRRPRYMDAERLAKTRAGFCPADHAQRRETRDVVAAAMSQLPRDQRDCVVLHVLGNLRFREIARATGESVNTVQSRYRYGIKKLQSMLNGELER